MLNLARRRMNHEAASQRKGVMRVRAGGIIKYLGTRRSGNLWLGPEPGN